MTAAYQYVGCQVKRVADGVMITSNDPNNADLQGYQSWIAAGNRPDPDPAAAWPQYQAQAKTMLSKADETMIRVQEAICLGLTTATTADVVAFVNYRRALRAKVSASTGDPTQPLPTNPGYPANT